MVRRTVMREETVDSAREIARRQLHRVLGLLALLDVSALILVLGLTVAWSRNELPSLYFLGLVIGGLGSIILVRVGVGIRLKRRSGNL
jgi:hypothetical protein